MKHLIYNARTAHEVGVCKHPQEVMQYLGFSCQHATPQSIDDTWIFWNCENGPDELPPYLSESNVDPMRAIGWGLSKEEAEKIRDYESKIGNYGNR